MARHLHRILFVYPEPYFASGGGVGTYLKYAVQAHLDAGRDVHLLTWATAVDNWFAQVISHEDLHPLRPDQITILRITEDQIFNTNPVGIRSKNISDILYPHVAALEEKFQPDLIETSDYALPLHSYLERRRCGMHSDRVPIAIFNHGLLNDIWPATGMFTSEWQVRELALEIQVIRWADLVLAPSNTAATRIREMRRTGEGVNIVREPYVSAVWKRQAPFDPSRFVYFGRVSLAKGVDIFAGMLTAAGSSWPISDILFVGRRVDMPFRRSDAAEFLRARLAPDIRAKARFLDGVPREEVYRLIADAGFFGNFSRSETFSYTTLEALSNGVVPLILRNSPMAELLPPDIRGQGTFEEVPHRTEAVCRVLAFWRDNYDKVMTECQQHASALTAPNLYARRYDEIMAMAPAVPHAPRQVRYSGHDVTVLISTHNDADLLSEAIRSVREQTIRVREILILDDGSSDPVQLSRLDALVRNNPVRLLRVRNMGLVAGRNLLVENALTPLVIFLDADDILDRTYVEKTLRAINSDPDRWSAVLTRRKNFGINEHEVSSCLLDTPVHWVHNDFRMTALIKRSVLEDIRFDPAIRNGEADDWWWWLNFTLRGYQATFVPEPLFRYRVVPGSMSLPWSEGQAALTVELLKRVVTDAARMSADTTQGFQLALMTAYRNGRDADILRTGQIPSAANENLIAFRRIEYVLLRLFGLQRGGAIVSHIHRIAYSHEAVRWFARRVLRGITMVTRPARS